MMGLYRSEVSLGLGLCLPDTTISSTLPNGVGGGETSSETGAIPIPSVALVKRDPCSRVAFGISFGAVGGARTNYPASSIGSNGLPDNPILSTQNLGGMQYGYGNLNSCIELLQVAPSVAFSITDRLSVAFGPTISMGDLSCDPLFIVEGASDPSNTIYGAGSRWMWGAGFQAGCLLYTSPSPRD